MIGQLPRSIPEVVASHLCTGCGACAHVAGDALTMHDVPRIGRRPLPLASVNGSATGTLSGDALAVCPGRRLEHRPETLEGAPLNGEWGPVLALYECWSTDPDVRHRGSSGGVATALAAHAVTSGRASGALHVQADPQDPLRNVTVRNTTYATITAATGSRYAPASPCERLDLVEAAAGRTLFVGKPCDVAAVQNVAAIRPALAERLDITVAIFCAGTPSTAATEDLVRSLGTDIEDVVSVDYRGEGWPGNFRVKSASGEVRSMTYAEAWNGTLTKNRQWRCLICPDHTGEFADLSVGDPWYREIGPDEPGRSLVVVRTEAGRAALLAALSDGALDGGPIPLERLEQSQPSLAATRGAVWGRVLTMGLMGLRVPRYQNMPAFRLWLRLPLRGKVTSIAGTYRRARLRGLHRPETSAP
ncbi:Coenzyme F420 hydrogenase/dehydrogenase, beta subunit C-terminal domain [Georgenia satyanarayanai]|uniref:Coenzyme F420 hydrogenase/dehydrogenase, beta subunit C-terminal domain n=1 Tax=Georgenia satyanarayanai TaxID=860221 RepID=UPI00203A8D46|nr:Coenzyme F420 hydrogenase/dehydrogenase, beta subunit C-terminal domain [Georgenia satyanarayanai]MCM3660811.1 Coenzyme F420 hydrogenase/dehydrogenase, beta subunit C-terminal domain [Georgenia satyanarayanai]